jgi:hypothetical protein
MSRNILLLLAVTAGAGGYWSGYALGVAGLAAVAFIVLSLVVLMSRRWSRDRPGRAVRDGVVALAVVLVLTFATMKLGLYCFDERAKASIDACERIVATVPAELANRTEYEKEGGLPPPWGQMEVKKFGNGEYWVRFHEKWRTMRRGLVYYPGNVWIRDSKMGSMHAKKVREDWYLFY